MDHHQLVIQVCTGLLTTHSLESGALKQGNISDMQDSGVWIDVRAGLRYDILYILNVRLQNVIQA